MSSNILSISSCWMVYKNYFLSVSNSLTCGSSFFFFKWANFRPVRFYHWWVKVRKQKDCFMYLPHMYMISNRHSWFTNLSEYILIKDLTTNFLRSRGIIEFNLLLWLRLGWEAKVLKRDKIKSSQSKRSSSTILSERTEFMVRLLIRSSLIQKY